LSNFVLNFSDFPKKKIITENGAIKNCNFQRYVISERPQIILKDYKIVYHYSHIICYTLLKQKIQFYFNLENDFKIFKAVILLGDIFFCNRMILINFFNYSMYKKIES